MLQKPKGVTERLVELQEVNPKGRPISFAEPNFLDLRARSRTLEGLAEYSGGTTTVTGGSEPARAITYRVSGDFFRVVGTQPFRNEADYRAWFRRVQRYPVFLASVESAMREGAAAGITAPQVLVERSLAQLEALDRQHEPRGAV